jgi:hypothetical protein
VKTLPMRRLLKTNPPFKKAWIGAFRPDLYR